MENFTEEESDMAKTITVILRVEGKGFAKVLVRAYKKLLDFLGKDWQRKFKSRLAAMEEVGRDEATKHWVWRVQFKLICLEEAAPKTEKGIINYMVKGRAD